MGELILYPVLSGLRNWNCAMFHFAVPLTVAKKAKDAVDQGLPVPPKEKKSKGGLATLPLIYWYASELFSEFLSKAIDVEGQVMEDDNDMLQGIVNKGQLNMLMLFLAHTGSRPGNILDHLLHRHLYFNGMHCKVYWLTLAFLKPETLKFLFENDALITFVMDIHNGEKGKNTRDPNADEYLMWQKNTLPSAFNILDLPFIFAMTWRILIRLGGMSILPLDNFVFKQKTSFSDVFGNLNQKKGIKYFTLYSMRYAPAKEDIESGMIPHQVTTERMTHTPASKTSEKVYAKCDKRIAIVDADGNDVELPIENMAEIANTSVGFVWKPLRRQGIVTNTKYMKDTFVGSNDAREDFLKVSAVVARFVENSNQVNLDALGALFKENIIGNIENELEMFSLGMHFMLPSNSLPDTFLASLSNSKACLTELFAEVETPEYIPEIKYMSQLIYGNWRDLNGSNVFDVRKEHKKRKLPLPAPVPKPVEDTSLILAPVPVPVPVPVLAPVPVPTIIEQRPKKIQKVMVEEPPVTPSMVREIGKRIVKPVVRISM